VTDEPGGGGHCLWYLKCPPEPELDGRNRQPLFNSTERIVKGARLTSG
jgi:hypothetical protein